MATQEKIRRVALRIAATRQTGRPVVAVVSAMAHETDRLLNLASSLSSFPDPLEVDVVAATGEMVAAALTALALQALGVKARSFVGFQLPIRTDARASSAQIESIDVGPLLESLRKDEVPVVAGFQGVDRNNRITTLGRGGSDTTAVALAAAMRHAECEIYTDVDGVFTADPNICSDARLLPRVSYRFMIEAAGLGAKVMHDRSVMLGMQYSVPIRVTNSFKDATGTIIGSDETEANCVTLDASTPDASRVSLVGTSIDQLQGAEPILKSRKIECLGRSQGKLSRSFWVEPSRSVEATRLLHSLLTQMNEGNAWKH